jgi:hypothetical protein
MVSEFEVPAVQDAPEGVAWLRASVARFSRGAVHERRRALATAELAKIEPADLRRLAEQRRSGPVEVLAEALGLPENLAEDVELVAAEYQPHIEITAEGDAAVERLIAKCGARDEHTANRIGLLVQACMATKALIAGIDPPVPTTRRQAPDGTLHVIDLTDHPFGFDAHACPGEKHALALAAGLGR